jgi:hypothetical protein
MRDELIRTNIVLTRVIRKRLQLEADKFHGGNVSLLTREILGKRYKIPYKIE